MKTLSVLLCAAALCPMPAQQPDYFPLHVGNQWIYRVTGFAPGEPVRVSIIRTEQANGHQYSVVLGLTPPEVWLRQDNSTLYAYDPATRQESVWAVFSTAPGDTYRTQMDSCSPTARVESREGNVKTPASEFWNALVVAYPPGNCADAGLTRDVFVPYIGLVERASTTIGGARTLQLSYARVGGVTVLSEPELGFGITLDRLRYTASDTLSARLTIRNTQPEPLALEFSSGQRFDLRIVDAAGEVVRTWSANRLFPAVLGTEPLASGERNWVVTQPLDGLPPGEYRAEGWITSTDNRFRASAGFTIVR